MTPDTHTPPAEILPLGASLYRAAEVDAGDRVVIHARGKFRRALVVGIGPKRVQVDYASPSSGNVTRKAVPRYEVLTTDLDNAGDHAGTIRKHAVAHNGRALGQELG
jgi:hypothetical protein